MKNPNMVRPANPNNPIGKPISSERARELSLMRKNHRGGQGRPRDYTVARCACGVMTLKRALRRGHDCGAPR